VVEDVQDLLHDMKMQEDQEEQKHQDNLLMKRIRARMIIIHKVHESMTPEERKSYHSFSPRVIPQLVKELKDMLSEINMTLPTVIWHLGEADNDPETQAAAVQVQAMINKTKAPTCMQHIRVKRKRLGRHIEAQYNKGHHPKYLQRVEFFQTGQVMTKEEAGSLDYTDKEMEILNHYQEKNNHQWPYTTADNIKIQQRRDLFNSGDKMTKAHAKKFDYTHKEMQMFNRFQKAKKRIEGRRLQFEASA